MIRIRFSAVALAALCFVRPLRAQSTDSGHPSGVVIDHRDLALFAGATLGSALLTRFDVPVAHAFADSAMHLRHPGFTTAANRASLVTETVLMISGGTVWGIGRLTRSPGTADVALHTTESVAGAAMFIQVIRGVLGRSRPYVLSDKGEKTEANPYDFDLLHGFTSFNYRSYPSMHAMASFAAATALSQEMRLRNTQGREVLTPLLYAGAAAPSLARMYLNEHWMSDIAMGIFLGVFSGQKVVQYSHAHPDNRIDRKFLAHPHTVRAGFVRDAHGFSFTMSPF